MRQTEDEETIRSLLRDDTPHVVLSDEQRARIFARVEEGSGRASPSDHGDDYRHDYGDDQDDDHGRHDNVHGDRRAGLALRHLIAAAAASIVAVFAWRLVTIEPSTTEVIAADGGAEPVAQTCPSAVVAFDVAVESWAGVENWSYLTDSRIPEPDLLDRSIEALEDPTLASSAATDRLLEELQGLVSSRARDDIGVHLAPKRRRQVVEAIDGAAELIVRAVDQAPDGDRLATCTPASLRG